MRLFIAADTDEAVQEYLSGLQKKLDFSSGKYTLAHSFHITLKFLGDVSQEDSNLIIKELENLTFEKFKLMLDRLGAFPGNPDPKVIWAGIEKSEPLMALQQDIEKSLEKFSFKKDHGFFPHMTLCRVSYIKDKEMIADFLSTSIEKISFEVSSFILFESTLTSHGPVYKKIREFRVS